METTFISIHDLSADARLLYASQSITDILGHLPEDVIGTSAFDYFHPDEVPFARSKFGRGVQLDKAAVLSYCRVRSQDGRWVGCECCFTIVHDVLVASTSIYRRGMKSQKRAVEAPIIRRLFASSPQDPRYHMLSHLSAKFSQAPSLPTREPRAALFLNRFSRTLTVMYATTSLSSILGVPAEDLVGKSFYYCIQENCLPDAIRCLESAKANDSIAYLRFWFRDPRLDGFSNHHTPEEEGVTTDISMSDDDDDDDDNDEDDDDDDDDDGGVKLKDYAYDERSYSEDSGTSTTPRNLFERDESSHQAIFGGPPSQHSSNSSLSPSPLGDPLPHVSKGIEIEAVVSCTSDGLVVVLRRARPVVPSNSVYVPPLYVNGLFASPWAIDPIIPPPVHVQRPIANEPFLPSRPLHNHHGPPPAPPLSLGGSLGFDLMNSIRDVAAFAWSLTGINGSLALFGRGIPSGESQPPGGLPVWEREQGREVEQQRGSQDYRPDFELDDEAHERDARSYQLQPNAEEGDDFYLSQVNASPSGHSSSPTCPPYFNGGFHQDSHIQPNDYVTHFNPQFNHHLSSTVARNPPAQMAPKPFHQRIVSQVSGSRDRGVEDGYHQRFR